jgi:hypothetical protein
MYFTLKWMELHKLNITSSSFFPLNWMRPHNLPHTYMCHEQGSHPQFCDVATLAIIYKKK